MTTVEPEWDQATRDMALALDSLPSCSVCGGDPALCQDPARQFDWQVGDPVRCHRTTALRERQKGMTEQSNPFLDCLVWPIKLLRRKGAA